MVMQRKTSSAKPETGQKYAVKFFAADEISPSPENDELYGVIIHDEQMVALIDSIRNRGLEEPIIITRDRFILSGHRRHYACEWLSIDPIPCRIREDVSRAECTDFHKVLSEYNPQRIKSVGSLLREAMLRDRCPEDTYRAIRDFKEASASVDVNYMDVAGLKTVATISLKKQEFLLAAQQVVKDLKEYWPLSIRQIHYNLLNCPPLITTPKRSKFDREHYRYRNDSTSYDALIELLKPARYLGLIPMDSIDDRTRPQLAHIGFRSVSQYVEQQVSKFLTGFHRHRQDDQPRHIELFAEKNSVFGLLEKVSKEFYVPLTAGRGFCSTPVWRDMAQRFHRSGKDELALIVVSDYDPEGLELADDAIRTLRDLWELPVVGHRVCITREQINELNLAEDFNPAKESSSNFRRFVARTGSERTWELEALPPAYLIEQVKSAIQANMDMEIFAAVIEQEKRDAAELWRIKQSIAGDMQI